VYLEHADVSSPIDLFQLEEILKTSGVRPEVVLAIVNAFRALVERVEDAEQAQWLDDDGEAEAS
jgi:hypothetical protein